MFIGNHLANLCYIYLGFYIDCPVRPGCSRQNLKYYEESTHFTSFFIEIFSIYFEHNRNLIGS